MVLTEGMNLTTPSLLFSAISLILLAYTNRFLSYAQVVRNLKEKHERNAQADPSSLAQIDNLFRRMQLVRAMQILGVSSLLLCLASMFFMYMRLMLLGDLLFGGGMIALATSLALCIWEINISVGAVELHLHSLKREKKGPSSHQHQSRHKRKDQDTERQEMRPQSSSSSNTEDQEKPKRRKRNRPRRSASDHSPNNATPQEEDRPMIRSAKPADAPMDLPKHTLG